MKTAIILFGNIKQVVFTPETETEKQALKIISVDDDITLAIKEGTVYDNDRKPFSVEVNMSRGEYLRAYGCKDSIMLVMRPKQKV